MSQEIKGIIRRAKQLHMELNVGSEQANKYLQFLKLKACQKPKFAPCGGCLSQKIEIKASLVRALNTLSQRQKAEFYLKNILKAKQLLQGNTQKSAILKDQNLSTSWYFFNEAQKQWETKAIEINFTKLTLKFKSTKEEIDLHNYILRASKKKDKLRQVLALESTETLQLPQTIRLSNNRQNFQLFYQFLTSLFDQVLKNNLLKKMSMDTKSLSQFHSGFRLYKNENQQSNFQSKNSKKNISKNATSLQNLDNKQNVTKQVRFKNQKKVKEDQHQNLKQRLMTLLLFQQNFQRYRQNVLINLKQNRVRKTYEYKEEDSSFPFEWFTSNFMTSSSFRRWKKTLKESRTLSLNRQTANQVFYQQHEYKDKTKVSYIYRRQKIETQGNCLYFIDTPVNEANYEPVNGQIDYVIWKIQKTNQQLMITSECKMSHGKVKMGYPSIRLADEFLGQMDCICLNLNMVLQDQTDFNVNSLIFEEQYLSRIQSFKDIDQDQFYSISDLSQEQNPSNYKKNSIKINQFTPTFKTLSTKEIVLQTTTNYLKFRHPQTAFEKGRPIFKHPIVQGEHPYFQNEFRFTKQGEMVSINQQKLKAQSSVLKTVLKTISKNIFSGKSILSISLPVTVFSVQSNLSLICKSYAYAPLLLQKAVKQTDPVERMKYVSTFAVTIGIAYLQMDKPFNPILGETFQTFVDGCLVYGQQVSHHPPISSTFMVGRGYKIYGSFEAKVNIGINSANGSNQGIVHISFDDKDLKKKLYKIMLPPGQVTGLTFGDRKVATTGKAYILDTQNMLYLQLNYNRHKGVTEYSKFYDGIQGKIVQLSPSANVSKIQKINKKQIVKQHGILSGRWTGEIYYENELIFNSWADLPFASQDYPCPLQSNAYFRQDLKYRLANDYESAQTHKQRLQQLQRNDRALRKKYTGKQHS